MIVRRVARPVFAGSLRLELRLAINDKPQWGTGRRCQSARPMTPMMQIARDVAQIASEGIFALLYLSFIAGYPRGRRRIKAAAAAKAGRARSHSHPPRRKFCYVSTSEFATPPALLKVPILMLPIGVVEKFWRGCDPLNPCSADFD